MRYRVLTPIKTADGVVADGYVEIPDAEVADLTALGVIGEAEPVKTAAKTGKAA